MKASSILQQVKLTSSLQVKWFASKARYKLTDELENLVVDEQIKPRKHPGIIKSNVIELPKWITHAINERFDDAERGQIYRERKKFSNYLFSRRLPLEQHELKEKYFDVEAEILQHKLNASLSAEELERIRKVVKGQVKHKLKEKVFAWKPLEYSKHKSLLYMITRSTAEYSVLHRIFKEIRVRDPKFDPQTIFDFGSGIGSVLWAANESWKNIIEYLGIDISSNMIDLSETIMSYSPKKVKGYFHRQYLPVSNLKHDLIVSAYSLMDLPDAKNRLDVISKLWRKTNRYLVIVEQGTNAGFKLVNEARDFIRHVMENVNSQSDYFTFAPCPHELACPRYTEGKTPCNFLVHYQPLSLLGPSKAQHELFSYVVLKKDKRTENDNWHRIVRPTLVRSKHARCRLCTPSGKLQEVVFTASKYGKPLYRCAKATRWGDRLPIDPILETDESSENSEQKLNLATTENENEESSDDKENDEEFSEDKENNKKSFEDKDENKSKKERVLSSKAPFSIKTNDNL